MRVWWGNGDRAPIQSTKKRRLAHASADRVSIAHPPGRSSCVWEIFFSDGRSRVGEADSTGVVTGGSIWIFTARLESGPTVQDLENLQRQQHIWYCSTRDFGYKPMSASFSWGHQREWSSWL